MKKFLNHAALFIGLVLISYPYLSHKISFLPQLTQLLPLRSTDAEEWQVKPGSIYDGDTLRVVRGNEELKIRFCGIDAPEKKQPLGKVVINEINAKQDEASNYVNVVVANNSLIEEQISLFSLANSINERLGRGEAEAIALATELQSDYVILDVGILASFVARLFHLIVEWRSQYHYS